MPGVLHDKVCVITGSTGIGAATARLAAREGAAVFVVSRDEDGGQALAEEIAAAGGDCAAHTADLALSQAVTDAARLCLARFGRIDALFNVAGISGRKFGDGPLHECSEEGWDRTIETNLKSMFLTSREVIRHLLTREPGADGLRGAVLNMGSVVASSPEPRLFATHAYAASKSAVAGLTRAMAAYYAPFKIRVNAIAPGLTRTPMSLRAQGSPEVMEFIRTKQPLAGDLIEADDVARAAVFLLGDGARRITGEVLTVDAGWQVS